MRCRSALAALALLLVVAGCGSSNAASNPVLVLRAEPGAGVNVTPALMNQAAVVVKRRLHGLGVASPGVARQGSDEIAVQLAGIQNRVKAVTVVESSGDLQFFDVEKDLAAPTVDGIGDPTPYPTLYSLLAAVKATAEPGTAAAYYLFRGNALLGGPAFTQQELLADYGGHRPTGSTILAVPTNREVASGPVATAATKPVAKSPNGTYWYLFKYYPAAPNGPPELSGKDINPSAVLAQPDPNSGVPEVQLGFTKHGAMEFQAITQAEYERGQLAAGLHGAAGEANEQYVQHNAIVLDGRLVSTPYIDYTDAALSLGIAGGTAVISNLGSMDAAKKLAVVLQSGQLPFPLTPSRSRRAG